MNGVWNRCADDLRAFGFDFGPFAIVVLRNRKPEKTRWLIGCPSGLHANTGRCSCPEKTNA